MFSSQHGGEGTCTEYEHCGVSIDLLMEGDGNLSKQQEEEQKNGNEMVVHIVCILKFMEMN
jgi:hypothetical protein